MIDELIEVGIRLSLEAEKLLQNHERKEDLIREIKSSGKLFISEDDVHKLIEQLNSQTKKKVIVYSGNKSFNPKAKDYDPDLKFVHSKEVTGKSRTEGTIKDFVAYFRSRFESIAKVLRSKPGRYPYEDLKSIKRRLGYKVRTIAMVYEKRRTAKGNILLDIEDLDGRFKAIIPKNNENLYSKAEDIILDDVIAIEGKVLENFIIAENFDWPDVPLTREKKLANRDVAIVYLSDLHFGSKDFLEKEFERFVSWLNGNGTEKNLAELVKYIIIAGDVVDGVGVYPNQEKDLLITDIDKQYAMFDDFVSRVPDHIEIIALPGNHDAVRRGEPMPAISRDLIKSDVHLVGNPSMFYVEGLRHITYHCTSMDSMISEVPKLSYTHPERVMLDYLKRRHLSPIYGGNLIIPEQVDYFAIDEIPDVLHGGHVHKNGYAYYRGTVVINSGTFQDQTEFQRKQGHVPTPARVPVYLAGQGVLKTLNFKG